MRADPGTWIVGVRAGSAAARGSRAPTARGRSPARAWLAPRDRARALAAALRARGLLDYAEPNRLGRRAQAPGARPALAAGRVARLRRRRRRSRPPSRPTSPLIGVVDTMIDVSHPRDRRLEHHDRRRPGRWRDFHGTAVSTVAAAPANGVGMLGIWPGARALNVPLPDGQGITLRRLGPRDLAPRSRRAPPSST